MIDDKDDEFGIAWAEDDQPEVENNEDLVEAATETAESVVEDVVAPQVEKVTPEVVTPESIATWRGRVSASDRRNAELEARIRELEAATAKPEPVKEVISEEPDADIERLYTEYPDFKNPLQKREAAIRASVLSEVRKEVDGMLSERVAPLMKDRETLAEERRVAALSSVDQNWQEVVTSTAFDDYVNGQEAFIAAAMNRVRAQGTTEEAVALLKRFKADTQKPVVNQQRTLRARDAEVVKSRPGSPIPRASADDYDSAFDEAPD